MTQAAMSASRDPCSPADRSAAIGVIVPFGGEAARLLEAVRGRICRLAGLGILARRLAEIFRVALDVEDVVDDLKRKSEMPAVLRDGSESQRRRRRP